MSFVSIGDVQQAVYQNLIGNSQLVLLLAQGAQSVFDAVPHNAIFPYLAIGQVKSEAFDTMADTGQEITITFHVWSKYQGHKEIHGILDALYQVIHQNEFILSGHTVVLAKHIKTETSAKNDGQTKEAVFQFKLFVE